MKDLDIREILILNCIVYTNDFCKNILSKNVIGKNVYSWACEFKYSIYDDGHLPGEISKEEFLNIIYTIKNCKEIFENITILDIENSVCGNEDGTDRVVNVLFSYFDSLIFVFKGTSGSLEWLDNAIGACNSTTDTKQQLQALKYFDDCILKFSNYKSIIVSGHSKGGNKAKYIAVKRGNLEKLKKVYSFEGQGFNKSFLKKYKDEIETNKEKIVNISNEYDFVNIILFSVSENNIYIKSNANFGKNDSTKKEITHKYRAMHSPYSMFDDSCDILKINKEVNQSEIMKNMNKLLNFLSTNMEDRDNKFLYYTLATYMIKNDLKAYKQLNLKTPKGFFKRLFSLIKEFNKKDETLTFMEIIALLKPFFEDLGSSIITNVFTSKGKKYFFANIHSNDNNEDASFIEKIKDGFDYSAYIEKIEDEKYNIKRNLKKFKKKFKKIIKRNFNFDSYRNFLKNNKILKFKEKNKLKK